MKTLTNHHIIPDQATRDRALDPRTSFIVQAPAGSGKTELLTQRLLVLLSQVNSPEEILAITFTKKSAHEMRARIINTLKKAFQSTTEPELDHAKKTWRLAKKVLTRDVELNWNLLANPNRLRIQTIDSFNAGLTKRLPILSQFGATPEIATEPYFLYLEAVQEFLSHLEENVEWSTAIAQLLTHMDNDLSKVQDLLITMLRKRDQWLPHLTLNASNPQFREKLESYLSDIISNTLTELQQLFPATVMNELLILGRFAAKNLIAANSSSKISYLDNQHITPQNTLDNLPIWLGIAEFFLTADNQWRKTIRVNEGFPAPGKSIEFKEMKDRAITLIEALNERDDIRNKLEALRLLPAAAYTENQWDILAALHLVLRIAVAQLRLVFQKYGKIDYIENAQAALAALGNEDDPTDIALALDYRIQHILVDEFQDTASTQYLLLQKLTMGWTGSDGHTLFLVGDPMQSIYRFREAEVGLFIRTKKIGLGNIHLEPLTLSVNFRSTPEIVNWVNHSFQKIFPHYEDIATGAISYSASIANEKLSTKIATEEKAVEYHAFVGKNSFSAQANKILAVIQQAQITQPEGKIAILIRNRTDLKSIIPVLKAAGLAYRAIKIDSLSLRPVIQDLMALTRALLYPADRIAWLAILRAPWCGLTLSDLFILTNNHSTSFIWQQLNTPHIIDALSPDGKKRIMRILPILIEKITERRRLSLRLWIESTWILLGGPACVTQESDLNDAMAYFKKLEQLDSGSDLMRLEDLTESIKQLFASPDNQADDKLQIMTIHNAKGLEFDTVILPHLERKPSSDDKQLLLWMERPRDDEKNDLIIAPVHAIGDESDTIYDYIKSQIKKKSQFEDGRLLYVAATRAKKKLHLLFSLDDKKNNSAVKPTANSLLEKCWPAIAPEILAKMDYDTHEDLPTIDSSLLTDKNQVSIQRLTTQWANPIKPLAPTDGITYHNQTAGFILPTTTPQIIGTLIHRILQQLTHRETISWKTKTESEQANYIKNQLRQAGLLNHELTTAIHIIQSAIKNILSDPRGAWILYPHKEEKSELALSVKINNNIKSIIIDRTFIDENEQRWIIDYKSAIFTTQDLTAFLAQEKQKYQEKMHEYALAFSYIDTRPIHLGLYFPLIPAWKTWKSPTDSTTASHN